MTSEDEKAAELVKHSPRAPLSDQLFICVFGFASRTDADDTSRKWKVLAPIAAKAGIEKSKKFVWKLSL